MANLNIAIQIAANDQASSKMRGVGASADQMAAKFKSAFGPALAAATAAGVAAIGKFVADSVAEFNDFEQGMAGVFAIMPNVTQQAMSDMSQDVIDFAQSVGRTSDEVVPALYQALSSGVPPENVFEFLQIASDAALGGMTSLETAVDGISSAVNAYGAETLSAKEASDLMFQATVGGKTTFEELSQSLYNVIPTAASLGLEFGNVTAALAAMTAQGTPTSVATTQLRQLLVELSKDGGDAADTFERLAGQSFVDFVASGGNLQEALILMEQAAADSNVRLSDLFSSVEAGNAALSLTGSGAQKFSAELDAAAESAGATADAAAVMADTGAQAVNELKAAFEALKITVGEQVAPTVTEFAQQATSRLKLMTSTTRLNDLTNQLQEMGLSMSEINDILGDNRAQFDLWRTEADVADDMARNEEGARRLQLALQGVSLGLENQRTIITESGNAYRVTTNDLDEFVETMLELTSAAAPVATGMEYWALATDQVTDATEVNTDAVEANTAALEAEAEALTFAQLVAQQQTEQLSLMEAGEREMTFTTQASVTAARMAAEARQVEKEATEAVTVAFAGYYAGALQATEAVGFFNTTSTETGVVLVDTTANQESLNRAMYDAAVAAGATAEEQAILGVALGVVSEDMAEAALKSAILQAGVTQLAQAYVAGDLSIGEMRTEMAALVTDVNNMDVEIGGTTGTIEIFTGAVTGAGEELVTAAGRADEFRTAAEAAAGDYDINFNITQNGEVPATPGYQGSSGAGYQAPPDGYALGGYTGDGPQSEIAGVVHRGEYVIPPNIVDHWGVDGIEALLAGQGAGMSAGGETVSTRQGDTFIFNISAPGGRVDDIEAAVDRAMEKYGRRSEVRLRTR